MKCQIYCRCDDLTPYWVRWHELGELWMRHGFQFLEASSLKHAYHKLWFKNGEDNQLCFHIGEIYFDPRHGCVMFHNGRHRTILLSSLLEVMPIAVDNSILESELFDRFLVRSIKKDEIIELPDLEIMSVKQLRQSKNP